jgi:hypothetical protein
VHLSRPRVLPDLELQRFALGKAAEAVRVDVALVDEHLRATREQAWKATARRGLCARSGAQAIRQPAVLACHACLALLPPAQLTSRSSLSIVMKPKPFWTSNHLHVPLTRSPAPVQKPRIGANMADLPDHIASAFAIDVDFAASAMPTDRGVAIQRTQRVLFALLPVFSICLPRTCMYMHVCWVRASGRVQRCRVLQLPRDFVFAATR